MRWSDVPRNPDAKTLRQFAGLWLVFFLAVAWWQGFAKDRPAVGMALTAVALVIGAAGLMRPSTVRPIFVSWIVLVFPIGWLVSHLVLGAVYYLLFVPIGLLFRLRGRDALQLRARPEGATYWRIKPATSDVRSYFRQF